VLLVAGVGTRRIVLLRLGGARERQVKAGGRRGEPSVRPARRRGRLDTATQQLDTAKAAIVLPPVEKAAFGSADGFMRVAALVVPGSNAPVRLHGSRRLGRLASVEAPVRLHGSPAGVVLAATPPLLLLLQWDGWHGRARQGGAPALGCTRLGLVRRVPAGALHLRGRQALDEAARVEYPAPLLAKVLLDPFLPARGVRHEAMQAGASAGAGWSKRKAGASAGTASAWGEGESRQLTSSSSSLVLRVPSVGSTTSALRYWYRRVVLSKSVLGRNTTAWMSLPIEAILEKSMGKETLSRR
jgi:hypothetical protein